MDRLIIKITVITYTDKQDICLYLVLYVEYVSYLQPVPEKLSLEEDTALG